MFYGMSTKEKNTEFGKITYDTSHTQTVFSSVQQNGLYVCSLFIRMPLKPYFRPDYRN